MGRSPLSVARSSPRTMLVWATLLVVAAAAGVVTATRARAAAGCRVDYVVTTSWGGGFGANVTVVNLGDAVSGWKLTWSFGAGQTVGQLWNGTVSQSGSQVTVTNASYNATIATGGSVGFGFNGTWTGSNPVPAGFALNSVACTGAPAGPSTGPSPTTPGPSPTTPGPSPTTPGPSPTTPGPSPTTPGPSPTVSSPPPPAVPAINRNYPVTREATYGTNRYTLFRPSNPAAVPGTMPVVVFGNGACAHNNNSEVTRALTFLASKGFVVVDEGSVNGSSTGVPDSQVIPSLLTDAISWAARENTRSGAPLAGRLDLGKVATAGHSCGGLEALIAGQDARVKAVVSLDSGLFADGAFGYRRSELSKLHTPTLFLDGGPSDIAYENTRANYDLVTVPAILAEQSQAGHSGFIQGTRNGRADQTMITEGIGAVVQFLDFVLNGNPTARSFMLGSQGLAAQPYWTVRSKNF